MRQHFDHALELVDAFLHDALDPGDAEWVERHCETCPVCKVALAEARKRQNALGSVAPSEASEDLIQATLRHIETRDQQHRRHRRLLFACVLPAAAAVLVLLVGANLYYGLMKPTPYDLVVLGQDQLLASAHNSLRVRLINHITGTPVAHVPVEVVLRDPRSGEVVEKLASFTTDADGTGQPRFRLPESAEGQFELCVVAHTEGKEEVLSHFVTVKRSARVMLSSDKPLYQPGQVIRLRALALRQPDLRPLAGQEVTFSVADPKGNLIFKQKSQSPEGKSSKYGIGSVDCPLADEVLEGQYTVSCKFGDIESRRTITVQKYVLPKFKVEVAGLKDFYAPGDPVRGVVQVQYFFGEPVPDGEVKISLIDRSPQPQTVAERTDADGKAAFDFKLPNDGALPSAEDRHFTLDVTVVDKAGQQHGTRVSRVVTSEALRVEVIPEAGALVRGVANKVFLYVSHADGSPAEATVQVSGVRQPLTTSKLGVASFELTPALDDVNLRIHAADAAGQNVRREVRLLCGPFNQDFVLRSDRAVYDGGQTVHLLALGAGTEPVFVDFIKDGQTVLTETVAVQNGRGEAQFDLPADIFGTLEMNAYRFSPGTQANTVTLPVRKTRVLYVRPASDVQIQASIRNGTYRPREQTKVLFRLTDKAGKPAPGALSVAVVDEALFAVLDRAPGMERTFYLLEHDLLKPVTTTFPRWSSDDKPIAGVEERGQLEQALFAKTARTVTQDAESSRLPPGSRVEKPTDAESDVAEVNGPSPYSLSENSFTEKAQLVRETRNHGLRWVWLGWAALFALVCLTGYIVAWIYVNRQLMAVLSVSAVIVLGCGGGFLLVNERYEYAADMNEAATAAPEAVGAPPFAEGTQDIRKTETDPDNHPVPPRPVPPNDDPNPPEKIGSARPPRVRNWFPETLLWAPELITDERGEYELPLEMADSMTQWRLSASAVTADGRLGATQAALRVFQPFFVDLDLPVTLTRNDEADLRVVVHDHRRRAEPTPQTVTLTLSDGRWYEPAWFELLERDEQGAKLFTKTVTLMPGEVKTVAYRIKVNKVGLRRLEVTARAGDLADGIERTIEVVPDGRRVDFVKSGDLEVPAEIALRVPANAIEGSPKAVLKIYPSNLSQVIEGLDGIFQMPHGCFEQTSSTTYPNVLALDYLRRTKKALPGVEMKAKGYIQTGYQRLLTFEVSRGGGFALFGRGPGDPVLSAYGLMEFRDMARVHDVDPDLIARTQKWLLAQRGDDGGWGVDGGPSPYARLRGTAYIAWAAFNGQPDADQGGKTKAYLLRQRPGEIADPYALALVCNALLALDPTGTSAAPYLDRLDALGTTDGERFVFWKQAPGSRTVYHSTGSSGDVETTALAALAIMTGQRSQAATRKALAWLVSQKDGRGTWNSTQATVLALKALLAGTELAGGERERIIQVSLGDRRLEDIRIPADQSEVVFSRDLPVVPGSEATLKVVETTGTAAGYQVVLRYHVPAPAPQEREPFAVAVKFDRAEVRLNDTVKVMATLRNRSPQNAPMLMAELPVPAGFALDPSPLNRLVKEGKIARFEVRGQTLIVYLLGLDAGKSLPIPYELLARQPVKVTAAAPRAYEYYDPAREGRGQATEVSVTPRP